MKQMQALNEIFQNFHPGCEIRMKHHRGHRRINRIPVVFRNMFKLTDKRPYLSFWHMQKLQIVTHQDHVIPNCLEVHIRQSYFGHQTGPHSLCWIKCTESRIKNDRIMRNCISQILQRVNIFRKKLPVRVTGKVDSNSSRNILPHRESQAG